MNITMLKATIMLTSFSGFLLEFRALPIESQLVAIGVFLFGIVLAWLSTNSIYCSQQGFKIGLWSIRLLLLTGSGALIYLLADILTPSASPAAAGNYAINLPVVPSERNTDINQSLPATPDMSSPQPCNPCTGPSYISINDVTLERSPDGHFYADIDVGGLKFRGVIDTGAYALTLPEAYMGVLGVGGGVPVQSRTANGFTQGQEVEFLPVKLSGVDVGTPKVMFLPNLPGAPLIGQSVLKKFDINQRGDKLDLHYRGG